MKLQVDFTKKFEEQEKEMMNLDIKPLDEKDYQNLELTKKLSALYESQYEKIKNEKLWNMWKNVIYPNLCQMAEIEGGRVALEMDESTLVGNLIYCGRHIVIDNVCCNDLRFFRLMLLHTEEFFIEAKDELIELMFTFRLYYKKQIADYSEDIKRLKEQM